ncbi:MAG: 2-isopropylmalate synthase [Alphaproteobacteria bacterium]|nr:2-isopropylmalate synthase [Alphaproteobacteria bacterium]
MTDANGAAAPPQAGPDARHVAIFDTTLRDGEQAPGFSMTVEGKLIVARALQALNVDVIEAGFAAASDGDFNAVRAVAETIDGPRICSLARLDERDIERAIRAIEPARRRRLHTFIGTSPIHREAKLKMTQGEILARVDRLVRFACAEADDVEFSAEDAIRTERDYLLEVCRTAIEAGATTINIPDTVGYSTPEEMTDLFSYLTGACPKHVVFSVHCHDDLGMAVANSLAAVRGGARQIECAINGIGERAGNCSMEEAVMALSTRRDFFGLDTRIDTTKIYPASVALARVTRHAIPRNKAIVGKNAFAHEAGIHQHGVLADKRTYEIMDAESVGMPSNSIVLGKHSGKHALASRAKSLGFEATKDRIEAIFPEFKRLADTCREVTDADVVKLMTGRLAHDGRSGPWRTRRIELRTDVEDEMRPYARVTMKHDDGSRDTVQCEGGGPIDAAFAAVCAIAGVNGRIVTLELSHNADDDDTRVDAEAVVEVGERRYTGAAREVDVADAAVAAFVAAINQAAVSEAALDEQSRRNQTKPEAVA